MEQGAPNCSGHRICSSAISIEGLQLGSDNLQELTKEACTVLDSYCAQVNVLDNLLAPVASRTLALSQARQNIKKARERAEEVLDHLDTSRKVRAGPAPLLEGLQRKFIWQRAKLSSCSRHCPIYGKLGQAV